MELKKNEESRTTTHYWGYRELSAEELLMVGGGEDGGDAGDAGDGGGDAGGMGAAADAAGCMAAEYGGGGGLSVTDGAALGGLAGGALGMGSTLTGGALALGDAIAAGTVLGGIGGVAAVGIGAAAVAGVNAMSNNTEAGPTGNPMGDYAGGP